MSHHPLRLSDLLDLIKDVPSKAPVVISTQNGTIRPGYHVTELRSAEIRSIDCGGQIRNWDEVRVQIHDGPLLASGQAPHMSAGKLVGILATAVRGLGLDTLATLVVEVTPDNGPLALHDVSSVHLADAGEVHVCLAARHATCMPMQQLGTSGAATPSAGCCG